MKPVTAFRTAAHKTSQSSVTHSEESTRVSIHCLHAWKWWLKVEREYVNPPLLESVANFALLAIWIWTYVLWTIGYSVVSLRTPLKSLKSKCFLPHFGQWQWIIFTYFHRAGRENPFTHNCMWKNFFMGIQESISLLYKYAGRFTEGNIDRELVYLDYIGTILNWCSNNSLVINISKTQKLIISNKNILCSLRQVQN